MQTIPYGLTFFLLLVATIIATSLIPAGGEADAGRSQ